MRATPDFFRVDDLGHGRLKLTGESTLAATADAVNDAIGYCRASGIRCLLVDVKEVVGFPSPTIAERFDFISRWAASSSSLVLISIVARREMVLEDKFGVLIAANRGMVSDVFTEEAEAVTWLTETCRQNPRPDAT